MSIVSASMIVDAVARSSVIDLFSPIEWAWLGAFGALPVLFAVLAWLVSSRGPVEMTARQQGEAEQARGGVR